MLVFFLIFWGFVHITNDFTFSLSPLKSNLALGVYRKSKYRNLFLTVEPPQHIDTDSTSTVHTASKSLGL